ncbi:GntR family transcriptional regulator [Bradyrhizobium elkanii]
MNRMRERAANVTHKACEVAAREGDSEQYYADNRDFNEAIYRACRNSFLADQAFALRKRLSAYRRIQLRARNSLLQSLQEHAGILKAIRAGDEQLAASRLHDHVLVQGERFSDMVLGLGIDDPLRLEAGVGRRNRGRCLKPKIEEGSAGMAGVRKGR